MRNYISYHKVECFICKKSFSRQIVGRKPQVELILNRNQYCEDCYQLEQSKKTPTIHLSKVTGFITIKIYSSFIIKKILSKNGYTFVRDAKGNGYWEKLLQSPSFEKDLALNLTPSKRISWLNELNKDLEYLLSLEKSFFETQLPKPWQLNDDPESKKLFSLDLS